MHKRDELMNKRIQNLNEKLEEFFPNKFPKINSISSIKVMRNESISPSTEMTSSIRKMKSHKRVQSPIPSLK